MKKIVTRSRTKVELKELKVELKDYNIMVDGKNFFHQPINSMNKTYKNIRKIATGKGDDYTTSCLLDLSLFHRKLQNDSNRSKHAK